MLHGTLIVLIVGLIVAFSARNEIPVTVTFLIWKFESSLALVAVAAVFTGIVMTQLLGKLRVKRQTSSKTTSSTGGNAGD